MRKDVYMKTLRQYNFRGKAHNEIILASWNKNVIHDDHVKLAEQRVKKLLW